MSQPQFNSRASSQIMLRPEMTFLDQVQGIKANIDAIRNRTSDLHALHRRVLVEVQSAQIQQLQQRISRLTDATSALIQETRGKIKSLSKANQDARVKETQQKLLAKNLVTAAKEFQAIQQDAKRQYKSQMERQYRIARPNATNDEIQYAIEHTDGQFFQQELMSARVGEQKRALQEVQQRNNDILKIEQSVNELFNMFQEMEMLLENQQGMVDAIEQHVDNTVDHMEQGSKQLTTAIVHAKSARRKKWFLFICCLIVLIILGVLAYLYFSGNLIKPAPSTPTPTSSASK